MSASLPPYADPFFSEAKPSAPEQSARRSLEEPPNSGLSQLRKPRADGVEARQLLLTTALKLFSEKGFSKTSTREIAREASVNIAAISYYFGDKAGLYRAVFTGPVPCDDVSRFQPPHLSLRQAIEGFVAGFLQPLKQGEMAQQMTRLHFREMVEPTGLWAEQIDTHIRHAHAALVEVLSRHLGVTEADDDVHRLAFSITGLAIQMFITRDVIDAIRPQLIATPEAIDQWAVSLADYAEAMFSIEQARRSIGISMKKTTV